MAIYHLGLPFWQYCFTPRGVPAWVQQIIFMDLPHIDKDKPFDIKAKSPKEKEDKRKKYNKIDPEILDLTDQSKIYKELLKYTKKNS